jgi:hypothetical protein
MLRGTFSFLYFIIHLTQISGEVENNWKQKMESKIDWKLGLGIY